MTETHLNASDYTVRDVPQSIAKDLVERYHYSGGGSLTGVYRHGLFQVYDTETCLGVAWWLPPTKVAAQSVGGDDWRSVLSLTRLVIVPGMPTNAASFLMGRSIRRIKQEARWRHLVTYADEGEGHTGAIYRATNWTEIGVVSRTARWVDPETGRHVSVKATKSRTKAEMENLGYVRTAPTPKRKFVMHL